MVVRLDILTEGFLAQPKSPSPAAASAAASSSTKKGRKSCTTFFTSPGRIKRNRRHAGQSGACPGQKLLGSDHWTDLAALVQLDMDEIHRKGLTFEVGHLGTSSEVTLGQPVMAVGTPYGLARTITKGIVSNTDRFIDEANIDGYETGWFNNWIQTDAAINPGNSGGPLIDLRGDVIGINTRGFSSGNNLGFAIPIDTAKEVIKSLLAHGKVTRSYIGVQLQPLQDLEQFYDLQTNKGVLVASHRERFAGGKSGDQGGGYFAFGQRPAGECPFSRATRGGPQAHQ